MPLLAFDTHKFITRLTEAGMAPEQAEVLADTYATILTEQVATKADIRLLQTDIARLDTRIDTLEEKMEARLKRSKTRWTPDLSRSKTRWTPDLSRWKTKWTPDLSRWKTRWTPDMQR